MLRKLLLACKSKSYVWQVNGPEDDSARMSSKDVKAVDSRCESIFTVHFTVEHEYVWHDCGAKFTAQSTRIAICFEFVSIWLSFTKLPFIEHQAECLVRVNKSKNTFNDVTLGPPSISHRISPTTMSTINQPKVPSTRRCNWIDVNYWKALVFTSNSLCPLISIHFGTAEAWP